MLHDAHKMKPCKILHLRFLPFLFKHYPSQFKNLHKIVEILFGVQNLNQTQPCHSLDPLKTGRDVIVYKKSLFTGFPNTAHKYP